MIAWSGMLAAVALVCAEPPATVTGKVVMDGKPAAGAIVTIVGARPSDQDFGYLERHPDVGRTITADETGAFSLAVTGSAHSLTAFVFGKNGGATFGTLPGRGNAEQDFLLTIRTPEESSKACRVRVLDPAGRPAVGALIVPIGMVFGRATHGGGDAPLSTRVTGSDGIAEIPDPRGKELQAMELLGLNLRIVADGFAIRTIESVELGGDVREVKLDTGCRVVGKITADGAGVASAWVDLVTRDASGLSFFSRMRTQTNDRGEFAFEHVPADTEVWIAGPPWDSPSKLVAGPIKVKTAASGEPLDAGVLPALPGKRIAGRIIESQGAKLAKGALITLSHETAWLGWSVPIGADGSFAFEGVPDGGPFDLNICSPDVMVSSNNAAVNRRSFTMLRGMVTRDHTDLEVEIVPFAVDRDELQPRNKPMRGVETLDGK